MSQECHTNGSEETIQSLECQPLFSQKAENHPRAGQLYSIRPASNLLRECRYDGATKSSFQVQLHFSSLQGNVLFRRQNADRVRPARGGGSNYIIVYGASMVTRGGSLEMGADFGELLELGVGHQYQWEPWVLVGVRLVDRNLRGTGPPEGYTNIPPVAFAPAALTPPGLPGAAHLPTHPPTHPARRKKNIIRQ